MMLKDKVIVIVGASGDIGRVLAREFHCEGATVILTARRKQPLLELQRALGMERTLMVPADATKADEVTRCFQQAKNDFGQIDGVVISAGTWARMSIEDHPNQAQIMAENHFHNLFLPTFVVAYVSQTFFRSQDESGLIANISSHAAVRPELPGNLTYGPMKAAARHFMLGLRQELAGTGVRVTDIQPAIVNTPGNARWLDTEEKRRNAIQPEAIAKWIIENFDNPQIPAEHLMDSAMRIS